MDLKEKLQEIEFSLEHRYTSPRLLLGVGIFAVLMMATALWLSVSDIFRARSAAQADLRGQEAVTMVAESVRAVQDVIGAEEVRRLAVAALSNPDAKGALDEHLRGRMSEITETRLFGPALEELDPAAIGPNGYAIMNMLLIAARDGNPPLQTHSVLNPPMMFDAVKITDGEDTAGYLLVTLDPDAVLSGFNPNTSGAGYVGLTQYNGRQPSTGLKQIGKPGLLGKFPTRISVPGSLFRVELPRAITTDYLSRGMLLTVLLAGSVMLAIAAFLHRRNLAWSEWREESKRQSDERRRLALAEEEREAAVGREAETAEEEPVADPPPMRLRYDIEERHKMRIIEDAPAELVPEIFRAYDIRGIVGKTLDGGIARLVGQAVGTLALDSDAGPVVVARDGRLSGPDLVAGMTEGIASTGCDVLDVGAVPTGVLYFAAHEKASGSGVMITGSHNPTDYNGFKIMVGGDTLYGRQIGDLYRRITDGDVRTGEGAVRRDDVVDAYIERIASDIELDRPLRVVVDCGNGIGGVCAAETLRAVGAEVLPLFDEVDGTFPNHHPDPSEPENLEDLIESVRLMDADLGLALDGDADRLGVVTLGGSIIYPDRVMMLLAMDVLDRVPGATILYDVKCTGHLPKIIREAGGNPVMYKTGHSLMKARMKEVGSPFAGEMSGHFFFGERWYGVDDGIYAAARLLEILAATEQPPEAIFNALPSSFSTPELKVQMSEGENHAFIESFKGNSRFEGASVSTIDGLRADYPDGWGLVRASNTTPILVVRFDADTPEALERIKEVFRGQMLALKPNLQLPF